MSTTGFHCPKCGSKSISVSKERSAMPLRILSCLVCGYRIYGEKEIISELKKQVSSRKKSEPTFKAETNLCAWSECTKSPSGQRAISRPGSKYCSRDCSNKNARHRYNLRKRNSCNLDVAN